MRCRAFMVALAGLTAASCGTASQQASTTTPHTTAAAPAVTTAKPKPNPTPKPRPNKPQPNPGSLPQTTQLPSAHTHQFRAEMAALWAGVIQDSLQAALPAFFPEAAYAQVKAIADPQADYAARLLGDYKLDISAAHALLGAQPQGAALLSVQVPEAYAHWVSPGACYNRIGYYEVPNARVIYRLQGQVRSFGIASMISWRGVWYVVHLGAVLRSGSTGVVDDPTTGPGQSIPSSTC